jgi:hypothetical protein
VPQELKVILVLKELRGRKVHKEQQELKVISVLKEPKVQ